MLLTFEETNIWSFIKMLKKEETDIRSIILSRVIKILSFIWTIEVDFFYAFIFRATLWPAILSRRSNTKMDGIVCAAVRILKSYFT